jgi:hypothetical protein
MEDADGGETKAGDRGTKLKKASPFVGAPRAPRDGIVDGGWGDGGMGGGGRSGARERSDETKEEGRPMLGDKSRLTSRERGL